MSQLHVMQFFQRCVAALSRPAFDTPTHTSTDGVEVTQPFRRSIAAADVGRATTDDQCSTLGEIELLPHQREGARKLRALLDRHGGALLADEVGLGKTYTALLVARHARRILIVAPATLRPMWEDACRRTHTRSATITSYERLSVGNLPPLDRWDLVILDEAHHARSAATKRYAALCTLTRGAQVLLLTATPIHNRPSDLHALLALFLGASAERVDEVVLSTLIVRRQERDLQQRLPTLDSLHQHPVPRADGVLHALRALPPPLPPADGGVAHALVVLQLTRAWCSSDAALLAAIRNRLATATALEHALSNGRLPTRRDLSAWSAGADGSVQLAFAELMAAPVERPHAGGDGLRIDHRIELALATVRAHAESLRQVRALVRGSAARDLARMAALARVLHERHARQAIVFTHSTETAELAFRALRNQHRVALLTGRGARIASGPIRRAEVLRQFSPRRHDRSDEGLPTRNAEPRPVPPSSNAPQQIDVLIASDVVSEGVDLQGAGVVVHLDLPWTVARLEQRIGRVRRLGSSHLTVTSHLITPPVDTAELQSTLSHLARKATLAGRTVGQSSLLGDPALWSGILPSPPHTAPATVRRAIVEALERFETLARARLPNSMEHAHVARSNIPASRAPPPRGTRWPILRRESATVLALVSLDGEPHLLCAHNEAVTLAPASVIDRLRALETDALATTTLAPTMLAASTLTVAAPAKGRTEASHAIHRADPSTLESLVESWCTERSAADLLSLPGASNSPSHRGLVHAIDRLASRAPRPRRALLAAAASEARLLIAQQRGAGSERLLQSLLEQSPAGDARSEDVVRWFRHVIECLGSRSPDSPRALATPVRRSAVLLVTLTLVPVDAPA